MGWLFCVSWSNVAITSFDGKPGLRINKVRFKELFSLGYFQIFAFWTLCPCYFSGILNVIIPLRSFILLCSGIILLVKSGIGQFFYSIPNTIVNRNANSHIFESGFERLFAGIKYFAVFFRRNC